MSALAGRGVIDPTPIQAAVLPRARDGECLLIHSETGSGKTLAYLLPALARAAEPGQEGCVLVLSPTRELAVQIADEADWLIHHGALSAAAAAAAAPASPGRAGAAAPAVAVLAPGMPATVDALLAARVVVATPPELASLLAEPDSREESLREKQMREKEAREKRTRGKEWSGGRGVGRAADQAARGGKWVGGLPHGFLADAIAEEEEAEMGEEKAWAVPAGAEAQAGAGMGKAGLGGSPAPTDARRLADGLSARVSTLVLDECDAIIPGLKVGKERKKQSGHQNRV